MSLESVTLTAIIPGQPTRSVTLTPETRARIDAALAGVERRTVDPATGEITEPATRVATDQPEPGALPEAVLDKFRQYA